MSDEANDLSSGPRATLRDIIETERGHLDRALTILGCTTVAINNDPCVDEHQFRDGDMVELARQMIDETTNRLDSVYLRGFYEQLASCQREILIETHPSVQSAPTRR